jgi:hypothetical protein
MATVAKRRELILAWLNVCKPVQVLRDERFSVTLRLVEPETFSVPLLVTLLIPSLMP